ncbi:MAG: serine hydrolase domain-containing protein [Gemmatimonadota bacterium]
MFRFSAVILGIGLLASESRAQAPTTALRDTLNARSTAFLKSSGTPGLAVGVWKDGKVVYARGFGVLALGGGRPVTPQTVFHMASISKTFVAMGVLQLMEQGKVKLDDPVTKYVPYFQLKDPRYKIITVRQVLSHTAGMPDVTDYLWYKPEYDDKALERYIRGLKDSTLIAAPGEKWQYSNIGFELLADLIATVSGEPFEIYVQRHILTPAGMRHSTFLMTDVDSANLATGHLQGNKGQEQSAYYPYNRRHAGSSTLHSNVDDMLRWGAINIGRGTLDGKKILEPATYDLAWKPQIDLTALYLGFMKQMKMDLPIRKVEMGLGWLLMDYNGHRVVNHDGSDRGFRSTLFISPDRHTALVVFANSSDANVEAFSFPLLDVVLR